MKKLLLVVLAVLLMISNIAMAETINLDDMSFAELKALYNKVVKELWAHEDLEYVEVPAGLYKIGTDIPAGKWEIHANPKAWLLKVEYGNKLDSSGTTISYSGSNSVYLTGTDSVFYNEGDQTYWTINLCNGYYIEVDETVYFRKPTAPAFKFN